MSRPGTGSLELLLERDLIRSLNVQLFVFG
jgi:hypothetical protein